MTNTNLLFERIEPPRTTAETSPASTYLLTSKGLKTNALLVTQTALAILSQVPIIKPVTTIIKSVVALGSSLYSSYANRTRTIDLALSIAAVGLTALGLAAVITAAPAVLIAATLYEAALQFTTAAQLLHKKDYKGAAIALSFALAATLSAAAMLSGCFPVTIAATALGLAVTLGVAAKAIAEKKPLQAACYLAMSGCQAYTLATQVTQYRSFVARRAEQIELKRKWEQLLRELETRKKTLDGHQEHWQFRSDHLPVGFVYKDHKIISWNVCNSNSLDWLKGMGLDKSLIAQENIVIGSDGLTVRDHMIAKEVVSMLAAGADVVALQECGWAFVDDLKKLLPENIQLAITTHDRKRYDDMNVTLFDSTKLHLKETSSPEIFSSSPGRLVLRTAFDEFSLVNVHVPGNPKAPGIDNLSRFMATHDDNIAIGDMNFGPWEASQPLQGSRLWPIAAYPTHGGEPQHPRDTTVLDWAMSDVPLRALTPDEVLPGLSETVRLLA